MHEWYFVWDSLPLVQRAASVERQSIPEAARFFLMCLPPEVRSILGVHEKTPVPRVPVIDPLYLPRLTFYNQQ